MDSEETALRDAFASVWDGFGKNHAKLYWALINYPSQSAKQLEQRVGLPHYTIYETLQSLAEKQVIWATRTKPKFFNAKPALDVFETLLEQRKEGLKQHFRDAKTRLQKIIQNASAQSGEEYLVKIHQGQTRLFDAKTKQPIEEMHHFVQIKKGVENQLQKEREKQSLTGRQ